MLNLSGDNQHVSILVTQPLLVKTYYPLVLTEHAELDTLQKQTCYLQIFMKKGKPIGNLVIDNQTLYVPQALLFQNDVGYSVYSYLYEEVVLTAMELHQICNSALRQIYLDEAIGIFLNEEFSLFIITAENSVR